MTRSQCAGSKVTRLSRWSTLALPALALVLAALGPPRTDAATKRPTAAPKTIISTDGAGMVLVPAGYFWMGTAAGKGMDNEHPRHKVWMDAFYMDRYEVTFARYDRFCDATGRRKPKDEGWGRGKRPVINLSWNDANAYCKWAGKRLPTEAEWERACRGGSDAEWDYGDDEGKLGEYAWYGRNSGGKTHPVGRKKPNAYGLYDMLGNAHEWVADWYDYSDEYYSRSPKRNPGGPVTGKCRVVRGGSWIDDASDARSSSRSATVPDFNIIGGCRCAKNP
jgi:formylglycine-generating enzyme required for sulfatase activity